MEDTSIPGNSVLRRVANIGPDQGKSAFVLGPVMRLQNVEALRDTRGSTLIILPFSLAGEALERIVGALDLSK